MGKVSLLNTESSTVLISNDTVGNMICTRQKEVVECNMVVDNVRHNEGSFAKLEDLNLIVIVDVAPRL